MARDLVDEDEQRKTDEHILKNKIKKTLNDQLKYIIIMKKNEELRRAENSDEEEEKTIAK